MSDYMFMLENHLSSEQNQVVSEVQAAAAQANTSLFLAGGAMRDVLGGYRVRDLDFTLEGDALKVAALLGGKPGVSPASSDEHRKSAQLVFPGGVTAEIAMARTERYARTGGSPEVAPATIQEDLRRRDFSINAIALSLNRASRGLLLDPANGLADLERHELRTLSPYAFYDDPSRMLRLVRLRVRLGFTVEDRTRMQYDNARAAEVQKQISPRALAEELRQIAAEPAPGEVLKALDAEGLLTVFSPALIGARLNMAALAKLDKARRVFPDAELARVEHLGPFLYAVTEKLTAKEKTELIRGTGLSKADVDAWQKLETRAHKLETALKSARVRKPSQVYQILSKAAGEEICFLLFRSPLRPVQDRVRNYFHKYLPLAQELIRSEPIAAAANEKARQELLSAQLDRRVRQPAPPPPSPPQPEVAMPRRGRANG